MLRPNKNSCKEFDNEKKIPAARKFPLPPPPPITFLKVRPLDEYSEDKIVNLSLLSNW